MGCLEDRFPVLAVGVGKPRRDTLYSKYMGKEFEHSIHCIFHVRLHHTLHHNDLSSNHQSLKKKRKISNLNDVKSLVTIHNLLLPFFSLYGWGASPLKTYEKKIEDSTYSLRWSSSLRIKWTLTLSETKTINLYRDTNEINLHPATNPSIIKIPEMASQPEV